MPQAQNRRISKADAMETVWLPLLFLILSVSPAIARSDGAPPTACKHMKPNHKTSGQPKPGPFTLTVSRNRYSPSESINVTIEATEGTQFKGFLLQAWNLDTDSTIGTFEVPSDMQAVCGHKMGLTHTDNKRRDSTTFTWNAPSSGMDKVQFRATVVKSVKKYWIDLRSDVLLPAISTNDIKESTTTLASIQVPSDTARTTDDLNTPTPDTREVTVELQTSRPSMAAAATEDYVSTSSLVISTKRQPVTSKTEIVNLTSSSSSDVISPETNVLNSTVTIPALSSESTSSSTRSLSPKLMTDSSHEIVISLSPTEVTDSSYSKSVETKLTTTKDGLGSEGDSGVDSANAQNDGRFDFRLWLPVGLILGWTFIIIGVVTFRCIRNKNKSQKTSAPIATSYYSKSKSEELVIVT